ncbi:MAG: hypothetical protein WCD31_14520 [Gillisia sp.]
MEANQFYILVKRMREAQKEYFRTRTKDALQFSKKLEGQVDSTLKDIQMPKLF